ncbi:MAG: pyridoxamine 5'-phosphate oxidase family protein [Bacteroidales bacterium]
MRRKEKQITDREVIERVFSNSMICIIAINDSGFPHIVPMNYGYSANCLYFHSAPEGRKIDLLQRDGRVSFMIEDSHKIVPANIACGWTTEYRSLMGTGIVEIITDEAGKKEGLDIIMTHHGAKGEIVYRENQISRMVILKLNIETVTCKESEGYLNEKRRTGNREQGTGNG